MTIGDIIGKTLITGHRRFLAKIHPDYFMECEPAVRKANEGLIRFLEGPLGLLGEYWKSQTAVSLSSKPTKVKFYTKTDTLLLRTCTLPFSDAAGGHRQSAHFFYQATWSLFGLFQAGNVDVSREVLSYVEAKTKESLHVLTGSECESGNFGEALSEYHSDSGRNQRTPKTTRLSPHDLAILSSKQYIQFDSDMSLELKRLAVRSLVGSLDMIEDFESVLGQKIPVIFVSSSTAHAFEKSQSIHLPAEFTPEGFILSPDTAMKNYFVEFFESMARFLRLPGKSGLPEHLSTKSFSLFTLFIVFFCSTSYGAVQPGTEDKSRPDHLEELALTFWQHLDLAGILIQTNLYQSPPMSPANLGRVRDQVHMVELACCRCLETGHQRIRGTLPLSPKWKRPYRRSSLHEASSYRPSWLLWGW